MHSADRLLGASRLPADERRQLHSLLLAEVPSLALSHPPSVSHSSLMATPVLIGFGAIAAAIAGRSLMRRGMLGGKNAAEQWVKGGFKAKMDRKEAIAILGLK